MAKLQYCAKCGIELVCYRKAVPGKGLILDLVEPHDCGGFVIHSNPDQNPTVLDIIEKANEIHRENIKKVEKLGREMELGDRRKDVADITPFGIRNFVESQKNGD